MNAKHHNTDVNIS